MKKNILILLIVLFTTTGVIAQDKEVNYSDTTAWYVKKVPNSKADVFYIVPTCTWSTKNVQGEQYYNMDIYDSTQRARVKPSLQLAQKTFSDSTDFYSPYYRQATMDVWLKNDSSFIAKTYGIAIEDVKSAFQYYMKHINSGRPFILAGHSQGALCIIDILKASMTKKQYKKMVAAYVVGFPLKDSDLEKKYIVPATDSTDVGVVVAFNSVTSENVRNVLMKDNVLCINPINWKTDTTPATSHLGMHVVKSAVKPTLLVSGVDENIYFVPSVASLLPLGNLHIAEFYLYGYELSKNVNLRVRTFLQKR